MSTLTNTTDQEWQITALIAPKAKGEEPTPVTIPLDRAMARKAWDEMSPADRAALPREPIATRDLGALAKDAGVDAAALLASLKRDALVRAALADGRLVLKEG